jgi:cytochrome c biogenesis protein CcdA
MKKMTAEIFKSICVLLFGASIAMIFFPEQENGLRIIALILAITAGLVMGLAAILLSNRAKENAGLIKQKSKK